MRSASSTISSSRPSTGASQTPEGTAWAARRATRRAHGQHVWQSFVATSAAVAKQNVQVAGSTVFIVARDAEDEKALAAVESRLAPIASFDMSAAGSAEQNVQVDPPSRVSSRAMRMMRRLALACLLLAALGAPLSDARAQAQGDAKKEAKERKDEDAGKKNAAATVDAAAEQPKAADVKDPKKDRAD